MKDTFAKSVQRFCDAKLDLFLLPRSISRLQCGRVPAEDDKFSDESAGLADPYGS